MVHKQFNLTVALKDGVITNISDVESGLKCGCVCPACGEPLVAKKGKKQMHHFAHHSGHNCEHGYESSLHLAAKEILSQSKRLTLPAVYLSFPDLYKKDELLCPAKEIQIDRVELEQRFEDIVPDVVVYADEKQFFIEIYVTHCIDDEKLAKLKKANISTIEIDLSKKKNVTSVKELEVILLGESKEKTWKYNSTSNRYLQNFYKTADRRVIITQGNREYVSNCPIHTRSWQGEPFADYFHDCLSCKYYVATTRNNEILCSARQRITAVDDFNILESQWFQESDNELDAHVTSSFVTNKCPSCGDELVERNGRYGVFWECKNYPRCRFTASIDPNTGELIMNG